MFLLEQLQHEFQRRFGILGFFQFAEQALGAVENARLQIILRKFENRLLAFVIIQVGTVHQVVVHAQGAIHFAAPPEQAAQREVQFNGLRINLDHLDEGFDGLVLLLVEQKVKPLKIRLRQRARLREQFLDIDACSQPAHAEKQRKDQQHPGFKFHNQTCLSGGLNGDLLGFANVGKFVLDPDIALQARNFATLL